MRSANGSNLSLHQRYFIYSKSEEDRLRKANPNVKLGTVVVNGSPKLYTSFIRDMDKAPADAVMLLKCDITKAKYTPKS